MSAPSELREKSGHRCEHPGRDVGLAEWICPSKSCRRVWMYRALGWQMTGEVAQPEPHPEPEVPARPATAGEMPRTAIRLVVNAEARGWRVEVTYARGALAGVRSARVVESIAVRMARGNVRAVGIWHDGGFATGLVFGSAALGRLNLTELKAEVSREAPVEVMS